MDFINKAKNVINPPKKLDQPKLPLTFEYAPFSENSSNETLFNGKTNLLVQAKGTPEYALDSLASELAKGHSLKNFEFKYDNLWKNSDPSKPKKNSKKTPFSVANSLSDSLTELSNNGKLSSLENLKIQGLDFSTTKDNGEARSHHNPLHPLVQIIRNNDIKSLDLQNNNLKLFDVESLLTSIGSKGAGAITEQTFANQTDNPVKQEEINNRVRRYIQEYSTQTNEMRSNSPNLEERNSLELKPSHLEVTSSEIKRSPSPVNVIGATATNTVQEEQKTNGEGR